MEERGRGNATLLSAATSACCIYEILLSFRFNAGKHKWARGVAGLSQKALFGSNIVRHGYMPTEFAHCMCARERERESERRCNVATAANRVVTLSVINACDIFIITSLYFSVSPSLADKI